MVSRQYEPGYIEAFRQDFLTDWSSYVAEAQDQLAQAIESSRRARDAELQPRHVSGAGEHRPTPSGLHYIPREDGLEPLSRNLEQVQVVHDDARSHNDD